MNSALKIIGLILLVAILLFGLIQLIPVGRDYENPPVLQEPAWDSPQTLELARRACFDCHSNETIWPWYSKIAPVSWLVQRDVVEGREKVNFSEIGRGRMELDELGEVIQEGKMPLPIYLIMHPEADLTENEQQELIQGFRRTFDGLAEFED